MAPHPDIAGALSDQVLRLAADDDPVARVAGHAAGGAVISCVGVLEALDHFVPLVEALVAAAANGATVVLEVPNTPLTGVRGASTWGEGALEELRGLLPADHRVLYCVPLRGSAVVGDAATFAVEVAVDAATSAPAVFVAVFGPRAGEVDAVADVAPADLAA